MPYVIAHLNPSTSTPSLHIFTSLSQLPPGHPVGSKLFSLFSPESSPYSVQCSATTSRSPPPTLKTVTSAVGKPLKSSLKRCRSPALGNRDAHVANISALPANQKSVRFREVEDRLESVCFFRATGRPSAIFSTHSDSDTESEMASSDDDTTPPPLLTQPRANSSALVPLTVADVVSPIPSPHTPLMCHTHVRLESLLPAPTELGQGQGQPHLTLRGIVRVRNIAYEKCVAARYTPDNWTTTIEVLARYAGPSPSAPSAAPAIASADGNGSWDRFTFTISLGLYASRVSMSRTLLLAVRFAAAGAGEWWDNNGGEDFRIVLRPSPPGGGRIPLMVAMASPQSTSLSLNSLWQCCAPAIMHLCRLK